jgi:hypothetical protein
MLTLQYAKNPVYQNAQGNRIGLTAKFYEIAEELSFAATADDVMSYGVDIYNRAQAGEFGTVAPYVAPEITAAQNKAEAERLLAATDWVNEPDVYNTANTPHLLNRDEFLTYREQVRVYAVNPVAGNINWPTKPAEVWSS